MEAERWKKIEALYQAALAQAPEQGAPFLAEACADDPQVRSGVESLLSQQADSFLESAPVCKLDAQNPLSSAYFRD